MKPPYDQWITEDLMQKNIRVMQSGLKSLEVAEKAGLAICFGTDLMASMQPFQNNEFTIRSQVQSNLSVLQSATINPARMMGLGDKIGKIAVDHYADLIILRSNPLEDIGVLDNVGSSGILAVLKEGRVTSSELPQLPKDIPI